MYDGIFTSPSVKGKLVCLNLDGTTKWISDQKYGQNISFSKSGCPAFADFNQDGKTEVYIHNSIFNGQTGAMLCNGGLNGIGNQTGVDPTGIGSSSEGTYELFRQFYGRNSGHTNSDGTEVGAVRGALRSTFALLKDGATHVGVATDHVITSFRNDLWPGYKTSAGMPPDLLVQFPLLEDALAAAGFVVWPMVEFEADDALGAAAAVCAVRSTGTATSR